jgi:titin
VVPNAPRNLVAVGGQAVVNLTWEAPIGTSTIVRYDIFRGLNEETIGTTPIASTAGTVLAYADSAITGGVAYYYKVKAVNSVGTGPASESAHATPTATVPGTPQNLVAASGVNKVTLTWAAPSSTGGSPITSYKVYRVIAGGAENIGNVSASTLTYVDTTGSAGTTYTYYVVAANAVGSSMGSSQASAAPQANTTTDNTMLYVGIAIAVIALIAIALVLMRRKK